MSQGIKYSVDMVFCIDATGSMAPIINLVKSSALKLHDDLTRLMKDKSKVIDTLRVRVIAFRDYYSDGDQALVASDFFTLPDQKEAFAKFVGEVTATGGGDEPENGLEAVALAMHSNWSTTGDRRRQIIVVWTDASPHPLEKDAGKKPSNYPQHVPANLTELSDLWEKQSPMNFASKRLIMYSPDSYGWTDIANNWENALHYPSRAGEGLAEVDYTAILNAIANSV